MHLERKQAFEQKKAQEREIERLKQKLNERLPHSQLLETSNHIDRNLPLHPAFIQENEEMFSWNDLFSLFLPSPFSNPRKHISQKVLLV